MSNPAVDLQRRLGRALGELDPRRDWPSSPRAWAAANPGLVAIGGAIIVGELLTALGFGVAAAVVDGLALAGLVLLAALVEDEPVLGVLLALSIMAIQRIASVAAQFPVGGPLATVITTGACLLLGIGLAASRLSLGPARLGYRATEIRPQLVVGLAGLPLGLIGAAAFGVPAMDLPATGAGMLVAAVALVVFGALVEELIYRGLFPAVVVRAGGDERTGVLAGSAFGIAAFLPTGSLPYFLLMTAVGLAFAVVRLRTGSILGTTMARAAMLVLMGAVLPTLAG